LLIAFRFDPDGFCFINLCVVEALCFLADSGLQLAAVVLAFRGAQEGSENILGANCLNEMGNFILVEFSEQIKSIQVIGIIELIVGVGGTYLNLDILWEIYKHHHSGGGGGGAPLAGKTQLEFIVILFEVVAASVELFVFSTEARDKAKLLQDALNGQGTCKEDICWCFGSVETLQPCGPVFDVSSAVQTHVSILLLAGIVGFFVFRTHFLA